MRDERDGPGREIVPRWLAAVLRRLVPARHRDEFLGDLAEEARSRAERDGPRSARRWLVGQVVRSAPHLLRMRLNGDPETMPCRLEWAVLVLLIGGAQAWDSGVLDSTGPVVAMVSLAILVPALALVAAGEWLRAWAMAASYVLLVGARVLSPTPLPDLTVIAIWTMIAVVMVRQREKPDPHPGT